MHLTCSSCPSYSILSWQSPTLNPKSPKPQNPELASSKMLILCLLKASAARLATATSAQRALTSHGSRVWNTRPSEGLESQWKLLERLGLRACPCLRLLVAPRSSLAIASPHNVNRAPSQSRTAAFYAIGGGLRVSEGVARPMSTPIPNQILPETLNTRMFPLAKSQACLLLIACRCCSLDTVCQCWFCPLSFGRYILEASIVVATWAKPSRDLRLLLSCMLRNCCNVDQLLSG